MSRIPLVLSEEKILKLKELQDLNQCPEHIRRRISILLMSHEGYSCDDIAKILNTTLAVIFKVRSTYRLRGMEPLVGVKSKARKLTPEIEVDILNVIKTTKPTNSRRWTYALIYQYLKERNIDVHQESIRLLFKKNGRDAKFVGLRGDKADAKRSFETTE